MKTNSKLKETLTHARRRQEISESGGGGHKIKTQQNKTGKLKGERNKYVKPRVKYLEETNQTVMDKKRR